MPLASRERSRVKTIDFALFALSVCIVLYLLKYHTAPWILITAYWEVNAIKNGLKAGEK